MDELSTYNTYGIKKLTSNNAGYHTHIFSREDEYLEPITPSNYYQYKLQDNGGLTSKTISILEEEDCFDIDILTSLSREDFDKLLIHLTMGQKYMLRKIVNDHQNGSLYNNYCEHLIEMPEDNTIPSKLKDALQKEDLNLAIFYELPKTEKEQFYSLLSVGHTHLLKKSVESISSRKHFFQKPIILEESECDYCEIKDIDFLSNKVKVGTDTNLLRGKQPVENLKSISNSLDDQRLLLPEKSSTLKYSASEKKIFNRNNKPFSPRHSLPATHSPMINNDLYSEAPPTPQRRVQSCAETLPRSQSNASNAMKKIAKHLGGTSKKEFKSFF